MEEQAEQEERRDGDERAQQGVDAEADRVVVRQVHPQHHEVALREVDHAHDPEDEGEADAHEGVDTPHEETGHDVLGELARYHGAPGGRATCARPRGAWPDWPAPP